MLSSSSSWKYIGRVHSISTIWQQHRHTYTTICIEKNVSHTVFPMHLKMCFNVYMRLPTSSSALLLSAMTSQMDILYNHNDDDPIQPTNLACNTECIAEYELCRNDEPKTQWALAALIPQKSATFGKCRVILLHYYVFSLCCREIKCQGMWSLLYATSDLFCIARN